MSVDNHGGKILTGEISRFVCQSSLVILPTLSFSSKQEQRAKEIMNLALVSIFVHTSQLFYLHAAKYYGEPE
jgi:hypothetical protein